MNIIPRDIQPYVKNIQIFACPESVERVNASAGCVTTPGGGNTSYLYNGVVMFRALAVIPGPTDIIFLREETLNQRQALVRPWLNTDGLYYGSNWPSYDNIHRGGGNLLFSDGHAKWQHKSSIRFAQYGLITTPSDRKLSIDVSATGPAVTEQNTGFPAAF